MKNIIKKMFKEKGFSFLDMTFEKDNLNNDYIFCTNTNSNAVNFYLILFMDDITPEFLTVNVPKYFEIIKGMSKNYDKRMDKNLSMVICYEYNELNKINPSWIYNIEEDPYFFKKYIFTYTKDQEEKFMDLFNKEKVKVGKFINTIVNDYQKFLEYKKNVDLSGIYEFCAKILIKFPILTLDYEKKELQNLDKQIQDDLNIKNFSEIEKSILSLDLKKENYLEVLLEISDEVVKSEKL